MTVKDTVHMDADAVMEQLVMQESRHMQMSSLVEHQLMYPDMTIRDFFDMAARELEDQDEDEDDFDPDIDYGDMREMDELFEVDDDNI